MRRLAPALPFLAAFLLAACGPSSDGSTGAEGANSESAGAESDPRPALEIPAPLVVEHAELEAALAERRGKGMLLNFWAIWCAPCVAELPELLEVAHEYADRGGRVVGMNYDRMVPLTAEEYAAVPDKVAAFLEKRQYDLETLIYDADDYDAINALFELPGEVPVTLAIDADGTIVDRHEGQAGRERFAEMMEKALGD